MKKKKATYSQKSRQDISSKNHNVPYATLLKVAKVEVFTSPPIIEELKNGRIVVHGNNAKRIDDKSMSNPEKPNLTVKKEVKKTTKKSDK